MSGWLVFYHLGHELSEDAKEYMTDLQHKVQKVRIVYFFFFAFTCGLGYANRTCFFLFVVMMNDDKREEKYGNLQFFFCFSDTRKFRQYEITSRSFKIQIHG
jgi:hypothetical protein